MVVAPAFREVLFQFSATTYFISLHFNMDFYCGKDLWGERLNSVRYLDSAELTAEVVRIFEHRERFYQIAALKALLYRLTGIILPHSEMIMPNFPNYREFLSYVSTNLSARLTVDNLADFMKMRRDVFTRCFTEKIGICPQEVSE